jgi:hypothetical protein
MFVKNNNRQIILWAMKPLTPSPKINKVDFIMILRVVNDAKKNKKKSLIFLTGVPGSGKTLAIVGSKVKH